ncbi:hypothetical protein ACJX0J_006523, partial [Zea mays]
KKEGLDISDDSPIEVARSLKSQDTDKTVALAEELMAIQLDEIEDLPDIVLCSISSMFLIYLFHCLFSEFFFYYIFYLITKYSYFHMYTLNILTNCIMFKAFVASFMSLTWFQRYVLLTLSARKESGQEGSRVYV